VSKETYYIPRDTLTILPGCGCDLIVAKSLVEYRHHLMAAVVERCFVVHHRKRLTCGSVGTKRERHCILGGGGYMHVI